MQRFVQTLRRSDVRTAAWTALGVFTTALLCIALTRSTGRVAALWLPNGIVLAVLLETPPRRWRGLLLSGLAANLGAGLVTGDALGTALALSLCNTLEIILAAGLFQWLEPSSGRDLTRVRTLFRFAASAGVLGPAVSAALAALVLHARQGIPPWLAFRTWFAGDLLGLLVIVPMFAAVNAERRSLRSLLLTREMLAIAGLVSALAFALAGLHHGAWLFLLSPFFLLTAFRFGSAGVAGILGLTTLACVTSVAFGAHAGPVPDLRGEIAFLQVFLLTQVVIFLPIAHVLKTLGNSERQFRALFEFLPMGVSLTDPSGHIIQTNRASETLLGVSVDEAIRSRITRPRGEIIHPDGSPMPPAEFAGVRAQKEHRRVQDVVMGLRRPDQADRWITVSAEPVEQAGMGAILVYSEITEQRATVEALTEATEQARTLARQFESASQAKSEFLANMSHEIRTPMNGVMGMAELLAGTTLSEDQRKFVSAINRSGASLLTLLNDILDFSKIEAGQLTLESIPFDLEELIYDVAELFRARLEGSGVELLVDFAPTATAHVLGDPGRLRQILNNLVSNAIKFTQRGHILVAVEAAPSTGGVWPYQLAVRDTGIGITPAQQARLFRPFTQADSSMARRFGGTGLGLTLVKHLTEAMGGGVRLESEEGSGTSLLVTLPLRHAPGVDDACARTGVLAGRRILVIDDLALNLKLHSRFLEVYGASVATAGSGAQALQAMEQAVDCGRAFDAALVDLHMPPGMDGAAFGRVVRGDPRFSATALVVLTGTSIRGEMEKLADIGFAGYLFKPIQQETLARALAAILRRGTGHPGDPLVTRDTVLGDRQNLPAAAQVRLQARILVVEDQEINQAVARAFLELAGATVVVADNGRAALELLAGQRFDLVLMDCQMPEMDGFEATQRIRALERGSGRHLPILAMTAHAMAGDRDRCLAVGMDDYLTKPISQEALLHGVARWLPVETGAPAEPAPPAPAPGLPAAPPELELDLMHFDRVWAAFGRNGKEMTGVVIQPFIRRGAELLASLRRSLETGDAKAMKAHAHALKGSSRTLALRALGAIAERLEREGATAPADSLALWIGEAETAFAAACRYLDQVSAC